MASLAWDLTGYKYKIHYSNHQNRIKPIRFVTSTTHNSHHFDFSCFPPVGASPFTTVKFGPCVAAIDAKCFSFSALIAFVNSFLSTSSFFKYGRFGSRTSLPKIHNKFNNVSKFPYNRRGRIIVHPLPHRNNLYSETLTLLCLCYLSMTICCYWFLFRPLFLLQWLLHRYVVLFLEFLIWIKAP